MYDDDVALTGLRNLEKYSVTLAASGDPLMSQDNGVASVTAVFDISACVQQDAFLRICMTFAVILILQVRHVFSITVMLFVIEIIF